MTKRILSFAVVLMMVLSLGVVSFAAAPDVTALVEAGMQSVQSDIMDVLAVAVPILIAIAGAIVAINFGLKYIRKVGRG